MKPISTTNIIYVVEDERSIAMEIVTTTYPRGSSAENHLKISRILTFYERVFFTALKLIQLVRYNPTSKSFEE